jgi:PAS domain S-box-containing protein
LPSTLLASLQLIGDHFKDCLTIVDMDHKARPCVYVNSVFTQVTGYARADAVGLNLDFLQGSGSSNIAVEFMRECFAGNLACCQDIVNYRKDGTAFVNRLVMLPLQREQYYYLGFQNDVTDQYEDSAEQIDLSLVSHGEISHVLNNALASILMELDMALDQGEDSDQAMLKGSRLFERVNYFCRYGEHPQGDTSYNPFHAS